MNIHIILIIKYISEIVPCFTGCLVFQCLVFVSWKPATDTVLSINSHPVLTDRWYLFSNQNCNMADENGGIIMTGS